jgi:hypothetical protein
VIWNSDDGDQIRTWKAHDHWIELSLSPTAPHLATSSWEQKIAFLRYHNRRASCHIKARPNMSKELPSRLQGAHCNGMRRQETLLVGSPSIRRSPKPRSVLFLSHPRIDFFLNELTAHPVTRTIILVIPRCMHTTSVLIVLKSLTTVQQRPAIPQLAGPSRNDARGLDPFWDSLPNVRQDIFPSYIPHS